LKPHGSSIVNPETGPQVLLKLLFISEASYSQRAWEAVEYRWRLEPVPFFILITFFSVWLLIFPERKHDSFPAGGVESN
jgi:hypothetical protein